MCVRAVGSDDERRRAILENCSQHKINCFFFICPFRLILLSTKEISDYRSTSETVGCGRVWCGAARTYFPLAHSICTLFPTLVNAGHTIRISFVLALKWRIGKRTHCANRNMYAWAAAFPTISPFSLFWPKRSVRRKMVGGDARGQHCPASNRTPPTFMRLHYYQIHKWW